MTALPPKVTSLSFRDIAAILRSAPFKSMDPSEQELEDYRSVVEALFEKGTVLPAPFGTVFRSADMVRQWLEINYISLSEGLHYLEGRCEARVHIAESEEVEKGQRRADVGAAATEIFRDLRRHAESAIPLRPSREAAAGVMSSGFLIARDHWDEFSEHVQEHARRSTLLLFEQSGPWPPIDFVRMDFGG